MTILLQTMKITDKTNKTKGINRCLRAGKKRARQLPERYLAFFLRAKENVV
jgi:hypothetical protein